MINGTSGTTTFPDYDSQEGGYTLDEAYWDKSLWPAFFGGLISWALFACLIIQVYFYFLNFPRDRRLIKCTVLSLFIIELGATAFVTWAGFVTHIRHWGHAAAFMPGIWGSMLFDCTVASIVHALYAWRIYKLVSQRWLANALAILVMCLSLAQFSCCFAAAMFNALQGIQGPGKQWIARSLFHAWLLLATAADVIITMVMAFKLFSVRTGVRSTDQAINKLLYVTIPGGAITACVTILILIVQMRYTNCDYYQMLIICLTKFYSNSVLVCLNLRASSVSRVGRHTMLTGFQTDNHITTSRMPLDVKVERKTNQWTSRGLNSSGLVPSSIELGKNHNGQHDACRIDCERPNYPSSAHTLPTSFDLRSIIEKSMVSVAQGLLTELVDEHPFRSSDSAGRSERPPYGRSIYSMASTKASAALHDMESEEGMPPLPPILFGLNQATDMTRSNDGQSDLIEVSPHSPHVSHHGSDDAVRSPV